MLYTSCISIQAESASHDGVRAIPRASSDTLVQVSLAPLVVDQTVETSSFSIA